MHNEVERHTSLEATLREIQALMERQEAEREEAEREEAEREGAAREQPAQARARARAAREHEEELEARLNRLHPADAAFVLESLPAEQRDAAWPLIHRDRRGAILLELAESVQEALMRLVGDDELIEISESEELPPPAHEARA